MDNLSDSLVLYGFGQLASWLGGIFVIDSSKFRTDIENGKVANIVFETAGNRYVIKSVCPNSGENGWISISGISKNLQNGHSFSSGNYPYDIYGWCCVLHDIFASEVV